jgi:hypothetical protein
MCRFSCRTGRWAFRGRTTDAWWENVQWRFRAAVPLYVCAECGDLGCGGVTAVVELTPDTVLWRALSTKKQVIR